VKPTSHPSNQNQPAERKQDQFIQSFITSQLHKNNRVDSVENSYHEPLEQARDPADDNYDVISSNYDVIRVQGMDIPDTITEESPFR
jgi:hypothetical protein